MGNSLFSNQLIPKEAENVLPGCTSMEIPRRKEWTPPADKKGHKQQHGPSQVRPRGGSLDEVCLGSAGYHRSFLGIGLRGQPPQREDAPRGSRPNGQVDKIKAFLE